MPVDSGPLPGLLYSCSVYALQQLQSTEALGHLAMACYDAGMEVMGESRT